MVLLLLRLSFSFLFLVAGLPAVGELRQEFANAFNVFVGPEIDAHAAAGDRLRGRYFLCLYVLAQGCARYPQFLCDFCAGIIHSLTYLTISKR